MKRRGYLSFPIAQFVVDFYRLACVHSKKNCRIFLLLHSHQQHPTWGKNSKSNIEWPVEKAKKKILVVSERERNVEISYKKKVRNLKRWDTQANNNNIKKPRDLQPFFESFSLTALGCYKPHIQKILLERIQREFWE